jgi:hypothetical protein
VVARLRPCLWFQVAIRSTSLDLLQRRVDACFAFFLLVLGVRSRSAAGLSTTAMLDHRLSI